MIKSKNDRAIILLIALLAAAKLIIHFVTYDNFELHRDAYLYYAQSEHLAWGFVAVPPSIAVFGKVATTLFGNTTFALRFFPALIGAANVVLVCVMVKTLGGRWLAVLLGGMAYLLSPAFLHTNTLFQPVTFNHFYWLLSGLLILKLVKSQNPRTWLWLGLVFGLGFLNKYSIVFFYAAFGLALLISQHHHLIWSQWFLLAMALALAIITPNLIWQYNHNFPVMMHMEELRKTQLVHVNPTGFLLGQLMMNAHALLLWVGAVVVLLFSRKERAHRLFGWLFVIILLLLLAGSGKGYYTLGVYPILFAFGAYFVEKYFPRFKVAVAAVLVALMVAGLIISLSLDGIPLSTFEKTYNPGAFRWEDGRYYDIPQDMADMTGWREIGETVKEIYTGLGPENAGNCNILCDHYGQAGAVMFWGKDAGVPQPICFNASFVFWLPPDINKQYMIWVDTGHDPDNEAQLDAFFEEWELVKTIDNRWFREKGTKIFLCKNPTPVVKSRYLDEMVAYRDKYFH